MVGTAVCAPPPVRPAPVHPHMRGDGDDDLDPGEARPGSPPHAWGRPKWVNVRVGATRFTPTCVGTAFSVHHFPHSLAVHPHMRGDGADHHGARGQPASVHPHMRGDGAVRLPLFSHLFGSPPHAWGRQQGSVMAHWPMLVHPHMRGDGVPGGLIRSILTGSPPHAWGRH